MAAERWISIVGPGITILIEGLVILGILRLSRRFEGRARMDDD